MTSLNFDEQKISADFTKAMDKFVSSLDKPSILLAGATGCGKSTLCNLVFNREICKVGQGAPTTKNIALVSPDDSQVIIYDSEGYELGGSFSDTDKSAGQQHYYQMIFDFIDRQDLKAAPIDVIWYCISAPASRVTDVDRQIVTSLLQRKKPVAVILTQVDVASLEDCEELKRVIREQLGESTPLFESTTDPMIELELGLNELHKWTVSMLKGSRRDAFIFTSNRDLEAKLKLCQDYVLYGALAAGAAALNPIPISDALIITPIQMTMIGKIAATWELLSVRDAVKGLLLEVVVSNLGKMLAGNIIKLIPVLGSWVGGAINATVAASITYGIGYAFNEVCCKIKKASMQGQHVDVSSYFNREFIDSIREYIDEFKQRDHVEDEIKKYRDEHPDNPR